MNIGRLASFANASRQEVEAALAEFKDVLKDRGIVLVQKGEEYQLGTHPDNSPQVEKIVQEEFSRDLTKQALETLAMIAYRGPMGKAEIDYLRGVNSAFMLRNLMMRGLIERVDNPTGQRTHLYQVSFDFLKLLGLTSLAELPDYESLNKKDIEIADA